MEDEDRALLDVQAPERPVERVAIGDAEDVVRARRSVDRQGTNVGRPRGATPGLGVAGMNDELADPGLEAVRVPEGGELALGRDEGALQGVLGKVGVAQDPRRDCVHPVTGLVDQPAERLAVAAHRLFDDVSHPVLPRFRARGRRGYTL